MSLRLKLIVLKQVLRLMLQILEEKQIMEVMVVIKMGTIMEEAKVVQEAEEELVLVEEMEMAIGLGVKFEGG